MNPTQSSVDSDLQKAIDDITNTTSVDPVFSDPVAAPSSVPEGDTGELAESNGPFPAPTMAIVDPNQPQMAPIESFSVPELTIPEPSLEQPIYNQPLPQPNQPLPPAPQFSAPEPSSFGSYTPIQPAPTSTHQVRESALRDLVPLLGHLNMDPSQKFNLYCDIFENLRDYTILEPAYQAAREIPNETERAEALLYLVEAIDKM